TIEASPTCGSSATRRARRMVCRRAASRCRSSMQPMPSAWWISGCSISASFRPHCLSVQNRSRAKIRRRICSAECVSTVVRPDAILEPVSYSALSRARAGDERAFAALTDPYRRELQLHCYRILGGVQDAEDALQETLLSAWRALESF